MDTPANAFVFAPRFNEPPDAHNPNGNDATGAFQPGAQLFTRWCNEQNDDSATSTLFNNHAASGRMVFNEILHGLAISPYQLDTIVYFGHGTRDLMVSARVGPSVMDEFVASIRANAGMGVRIILYACSCGAAGGFAEALAGRLSDMNATVYGHAVAGHAFLNPILRRYPGVAQVCPEGMGTAWRAAFANPRNDLWIRSPFMTDDELRAELS